MHAEASSQGTSSLPAASEAARPMSAKPLLALLLLCSHQAHAALYSAVAAALTCQLCAQRQAARARPVCQLLQRWPGLHHLQSHRWPCHAEHRQRPRLLCRKQRRHQTVLQRSLLSSARHRCVLEVKHVCFTSYAEHRQRPRLLCRKQRRHQMALQRSPPSSARHRCVVDPAAVVYTMHASPAMQSFVSIHVSCP